MTRMFAMVLTVAFVGFVADRAYQALMHGCCDGGNSAATIRRGPRRAGRWRRRAAAAGWGLAPLVPIIALVLGWEALARSGAVTPFMLPALSAVLERIWTDAVVGELFLNAGVTLYRAFAGFRSRLAPASCSAWPCRATGRALVLRSDHLGRLSDAEDRLPAGRHPVARRLRLLQDRHDRARRDLPVVTATIVGIQGVDRHLIWSARNMGASERELLWQIVLPAALPQILTGLQVALPIALIVAIVAEMLMGGYGLGGAMMHASRFADSRGVFAGIVEIAVVGYVLVKAMALMRRRAADLAPGGPGAEHGVTLSSRPSAKRASRDADGVLFDACHRLLDDRKIDVLGEVDLGLHEAEVGRHVEVLLQRLEVGQHVRVAVVVLLGEQPAEPLGRLLGDAGGDLGGLLLVVRVEIPAHDP